MALTSQEIDYQAHNIIYGRYQWHKTPAVETNGTQTIDTSGGQNLTWNYPADKVFNPAISYLKLTYTTSAASGAGIYQYMPADHHPWWRIVDWSPTSGQPLVHIEEYDHYSKLAMRPAFHYDDYKTFDKMSPFYKCNTANSQNKRPDGQNCGISWEDPTFWKVSGANAQLSGTLYIPLSQFIDTALAVNKDMYMGQISTFQLTFKPTTQFLFTATDQYNPTTGTAAIANNITFNINNAVLMLAIEQNTFLVDEIKQRYASGQQQIIIPYVKKVNKTLLSNAQSLGIIVRLYPKDGFKIVKMIQGFFNNEYVGSNFANTTLPAYGAGNTMYTTWNSQRIQENDLTLGTDDYLWMREKLKGTCYLSNQSFQDAYAYIDYFDEPIPKSEEDLPQSNRIVGYDLTTENIWEYNLNFAGNQTGNAYTFPVALKKMIVGLDGVTVFP